jgi:hypothetical protein
MALQPIAPNSSPQFQLTPAPAGIVTSIDQIAWAVSFSDDSSDSTIVPNENDPSGMTATVEIGPTASPGAVMSIEVVYRNPSGSVVSDTWNFTVVE